MKTLLLCFAILAVFIMFHHDAPTYSVVDIATPQADGSIAHDIARVDTAKGTMCSLHEAFWYQGAFVEPCEGK